MTKNVISILIAFATVAFLQSGYDDGSDGDGDADGDADGDGDGDADGQ